MSEYPLTCSGPGPHDPADGVLGSTSVEGATAICGATACLPALEAPAADPAAAVLTAVQTARNEVAGYAASNGTRQAVEALATAVETLVQGATP